MLERLLTLVAQAVSLLEIAGLLALAKLNEEVG